MREREKTGVFQVGSRQMRDVAEALRYVYAALLERGYNLCSEGGPSAMPRCRGRRELVGSLEEKALVQIRRFLGVHHGHTTSGPTCRQP
jgi:uncharacterized protein (UPF0297 family)